MSAGRDGRADNGSAAGLVILLHGYDDDPAAFQAWAEQIAPPGFAAAAPTGPLSTEHGASWFLTDADHDPDPASMRAAVATLDSVIDRLADDHGVSRAETYVGGFSQGAALAWHWALEARTPGDATVDGRVAGLYAVSGWLPAVDGVDLDPGSCRAPRVLVAHGEDDEAVPAPLGRGPGRLVARHGVDVTFVDRPVGHTLAPFVADVRDWIDRS